MIKSLREFFESRIKPQASAGGALSGHGLQLATAALLIEMTRADFSVSGAERETVDRMLQQTFGLSEQETRQLVDLAEVEVRTSASLFQFTHLIDKQFTLEQKISVIELLWRVAYADARKDKHEEHLVRKIADLLHVPHTAYVYARDKVERDLEA